MGNDIKRFFMFANRYEHRYGELNNFLYNHPDYNDNSVFILFNKMLPLSFDAVYNFTRKWIYFRCLFSQETRKLTYQNLDLLNDISFEKFYSLPECFSPQHQAKEYCEIFCKLIHEKKIDIGKLSHSTSDHKDHQTLTDRINRGNKPYHKSKNLSSGLWAYIYLKYKYPNAKFTLIGFNSDISPNNHAADIERKYFLADILFLKNRIETFNSF